MRNFALMCSRPRSENGSQAGRIRAACPVCRKGGQVNHPLDGSPSLFAQLSGGNASRSFFTGASPRAPAAFEKAGETFRFCSPVA